MKLSVFLAQSLIYCRKSLKRLFRNKTHMFFVFLFPVLMLLMLGSVFGGSNDSMTGFTVGVVNLDYEQASVNGTMIENGTLSDILIDVLDEVNMTTVEVSEVGDTSTNGTAMYLLARGRIDAYIVIPENFTECLTLQYVTLLPNGTPVPIPISPTIRIVVSPTDPVASNIVSKTLAGIISGFSEKYQEFILDYQGGQDHVTEAFMRFLANPVKSSTTEADITSIDTSWITYMVPGTLGIVILWAGFSNAARGFARERETGTLKRLIVASASPAALLLGEYLYNLIVIVLSAAFALLTGVLVFQVSLHWDLLALAVFTLAVSMSAIGPGLILSSIVKNAETAGSIQTVVAIPLQFFVGSFFPLFLLPQAGQAFALALPYTQYSLAITDIMVKGLTIGDVLSNLIYITVVGAVLLVLGVVAFKRALSRL